MLEEEGEVLTSSCKGGRQKGRPKKKAWLVGDGVCVGQRQIPWGPGEEDVARVVQKKKKNCVGMSLRNTCGLLSGGRPHTKNGWGKTNPLFLVGAGLPKGKVCHAMGHVESWSEGRAISEYSYCP